MSADSVGDMSSEASLWHTSWRRAKAPRDFFDAAVSPACGGHWSPQNGAIEATDCGWLAPSRVSLLGLRGLRGMDNGAESRGPRWVACKYAFALAS